MPLKHRLKDAGSNLAALRALTDAPMFEHIAAKHGNNVINYEISTGTAIGFGLFKDEGISVQRVFCSAGTLFDWHNHAECEWLMVYAGEMIVNIEDGDDISLPEGDWVFLAPNQRHCARFTADTWILAITIPQSAGYPDA